MTVERSTERFRTVVFDRAFMRQLIQVGQAMQEGSKITVYKHLAPDVICLIPWFLVVPAPYKADVAKLVEEVYPEFKGRKLDEQLLEEFVGRLHQLIWQRLEYKPPEALRDRDQ